MDVFLPIIGAVYDQIEIVPVFRRNREKLLLIRCCAADVVFEGHIAVRGQRRAGAGIFIRFLGRSGAVLFGRRGGRGRLGRGSGRRRDWRGIAGLRNGHGLGTVPHIVLRLDTDRSAEIFQRDIDLPIGRIFASVHIYRRHAGEVVGGLHMERSGGEDGVQDRRCPVKTARIPGFLVQLPVPASDIHDDQAVVRSRHDGGVLPALLFQFSGNIPPIPLALHHGPRKAVPGGVSDSDSDIRVPVGPAGGRGDLDVDAGGRIPRQSRNGESCQHQHRRQQNGEDVEFSPPHDLRPPSALHRRWSCCSG